MNTSILHVELKKALHVLDTNISAWARQLQKPDGSVGITRSAVIQVAKGKSNTDWIQRAIKAAITRARREYPQYYKEAV